MVIELCEQITYCLLKENKPNEALKILNELEVMQDIIEEQNLKAIVYFGKTHLKLQNLKEAYDYFSKAYQIADNKTKKDIKSILDRIELGFKEQNKDLNTSKTKTGHACSTLTLSDLELTPMNSQCSIRDGDLEMDVLTNKLQAESISSQKKAFTGTVEICTIKASAGILAEYTQKSGNILPIYNLTNTTLESFNKKTFHMTCECVGHTETGSASTKQNAKEKAAQKMLKYLQDAGMLRLTTNLGL
jgi:tetratricopeptide (TPR) repeat protein